MGHGTTSNEMSSAVQARKRVRLGVYDRSPGAGAPRLRSRPTGSTTRRPVPATCKNAQQPGLRHSKMRDLSWSSPCESSRGRSRVRAQLPSLSPVVLRPPAGPSTHGYGAVGQATAGATGSLRRVTGPCVTHPPRPGTSWPSAGPSAPACPRTPEDTPTSPPRRSCAPAPPPPPGARTPGPGRPA